MARPNVKITVTEKEPEALAPAPEPDKLAVGMTVRLSPKSEFWGQSEDQDGLIVSVNYERLPYGVRWRNGNLYSYGRSDLIWVDRVDPSEFRVGRKVRLRTDSEYRGQSVGSEGEIVKDEGEGWVDVVWKNGMQYQYRTGATTGQCDLELV